MRDRTGFKLNLAKMHRSIKKNKESTARKLLLAQKRVLDYPKSKDSQIVVAVESGVII